MKKLLLTGIVLTVISCGKGSKSFKIGDNIHTTEQTVATVTESDFDEMVQISNAKDGLAFTQMITDGRMYIVPENATLNVEEIKVGKVKAQYQDKSLWFNSDYVE